MTSVLLDLEETIPEVLPVMEELPDNEYSALSVSQLKKLCKERKIKNFSSLNKPKLIAKLLEEVSEPEPEKECHGHTRKGDTCKSKNTTVPENSEFAYCPKHLKNHLDFEQPSNELVMSVDKGNDDTIVDASIKHQQLSSLSVSELRELCKNEYHIAITTKMTKAILIEKIEKKTEELEDDTPLIKTKEQFKTISKLRKIKKQEPYYEPEEEMNSIDYKVLKSIQSDNIDNLEEKDEEKEEEEDEEEDDEYSHTD
jgi:hypothetical protein